ncbi:conserved hypothetical protein [Sporisorium reilianum SRZ2]|uniref:PHD-type domain-containing protein n=1 Tax=Sporisorium reilianum (strain SRZ2) TaxID=999809 RepID=E6ZWV5_SPORE|nr:conserved hypothetical protein [Sporisorium reilianum SRZ2]
MSAPSLPSNWYELAIKARTAALRESQQRTTTLASLPSEPATQDANAPTSNLEHGAAQPNGVLKASTDSKPMPVPKTEPVEASLAPTETQASTTTTAEASHPSPPLAGGLVGVSSSDGPEPSTQTVTPAPSATQQPIIAALSSPYTSRDPPLEGDALRTEVMGPPPSLPADAGYPPLNPVITDVQAPPPNPKRRAGSSAVNGTQRRPAPAQAPLDFVPPTNLNGKMPFALFQTLQKGASTDSDKPLAQAAPAERTQSESTSGDAPVASNDADAQQAHVSTSADSNPVDPLLADVLTDADSVATATATRETSPDATPAQDSAVQAAPQATEAAQPSATDKAEAMLPATSPVDAVTAAPTASGAVAVAVAEADETASPAAALRRNPSNRGASLQASQSITSAYADPLGLKKHRESLLQEQARARRSPSASSTGAPPVSSPAPASAGGAKKSNAARTIVPPPLVEPPAGMMYTAEGRLRTIPGIAGAIVPPAPSSTSTDTNLTPRLEDKGGANNDFCETCGGHGRFVCCDGCPRSFHFHCMSPPLDIDEMPPSNAAEVLGPAKASTVQKGKAKADAPGSPNSEINMDEMWFCNVCVAERKPKAMPKPKGLGPFGYLLPVLSQQNPKSFQLPTDIRTYFKDVATANDGDYINGGMARQLKPNRHGQIEARDPYRLKDKNGDAVLCYRCGGTALPAESEQQPQQHNAVGSGTGSKSRKAGVNKARSGSVFGDVAPSTPAEHTVREGTGWRKIVSCDFCPLHWHIDCVDPPMLGMPSNLRKWMCPAHSDHVNDRRRVARVGAAVPRTVDLPLPSARTIGPGKHFRTRVLNNGDIDIIPDPMEELVGANGITGSLQSGIKEIPLLPGVIDAPAITDGGSKLASKIRYRFPEKVIRTDFWTKLRADDSSKIGDVFYVAAEEIAHRAPVRLVATEDGATAGGDDSRFRPFGRRQNALSGLDALADIASSRLKADQLVGDESVATSFKKPSRTRQLIATALGIDLTNDDVPESSLRSSLEESTESSAVGSSSDSPLSSLSESETDAAPADASAAAASVSQPAPETPKAAAPAAAPAPAPVVALSEEELIKRIALEAATGVSSGDPVRLSKRKAAVAADAAIAGSPSTPAKKLRSDSPAATPTPAHAAAAAPAAVTVPVEVRPAGTTAKRIITLKTNGSAAAAAKKETLSESQVALRTAYHLADQYADERKEIEQLRAIRELMKLKGPARMMEFLLSPNEGDGA